MKWRLYLVSLAWPELQKKELKCHWEETPTHFELETHQPFLIHIYWIGLYQIGLDTVFSTFLKYTVFSTFL